MHQVSGVQWDPVMDRALMMLEEPLPWPGPLLAPPTLSSGDSSSKQQKCLSSPVSTSSAVHYPSSTCTHLLHVHAPSSHTTLQQRSAPTRIEPHVTTLNLQ
ncbi:unnamed protein product [Gadus morhua 'NCC']